MYCCLRVSDVVLQAFMKLDTHKLGTTSLTEIRKACKNTEGTIWQNMESVLQSNSSDSVSYAVSLS